MHHLIFVSFVQLPAALEVIRLKLPFHGGTLFLAPFWWTKCAVSSGRSDTSEWQASLRPNCLMKSANASPHCCRSTNAQQSRVQRIGAISSAAPMPGSSWAFVRRPASCGSAPFWRMPPGNGLPRTGPVCPVGETVAPHRMGAALTYARRNALSLLMKNIPR